MGHARRVDEAERRRRAHAWVEKHAAEQGVSVKVTDPVTLDLVARILTGEWVDTDDQA